MKICIRLLKIIIEEEKYMVTPWEEVCNPQIIAHSQLMISTYRDLLGAELLSLAGSPEENAYELYHSKSVMLSHNGSANPLFTYANATAQKLWEFSWSEFIGMPSKQSVEQDRRQERQGLLDAADESGYIKNYHGERISKSNRRFAIEGVILWNLDQEGVKVGQAATFDKWTFV
jgi:hypothetical protein